MSFKSTIQLSLAVLLALPAALSLQAQDATPPVYAPYPANLPVNYIRTWDALSPGTDANALMSKSRKEVLQTTAYADGLGRSLQTVVKQGSLAPGATVPVDLVTAKVYDEYGREVRTYLPFATAGTKGAIVFNPFEQQQLFYSDNNTNSPVKGQGETFYYGKTEFEPSPLNRVERTYAAGNSWVNQGRGAQIKYLINTDVDEVRIWNVTEQAGTFASYSTPAGSTGIYTAGTLTKTITIDERGKQVIEFKDRQGLTILKKVQVDGPADDGSGSAHDNWLCTYYIYDDYNLLRAVIQPLGVKLLKQNSWVINDGILNEQCFRYEYDPRDRIIMKKVPGAGAVQMVYNNRDLVVLTQDANMALPAQMQWLVTTYDALDRPAATYKITDAAHYNDAAYYRNNPSGLNILLSGLTDNDLLTETHYDDYTGIPAGFSTSALQASGYGPYMDAQATEYPDPMTLAGSAKGWVTWTRARILGESNFIITCNLYDAKGRVIQTQSRNYTGLMDVITKQYSFSGQLLRSHIKHQKGGTNALTVELGTKNTYDDLGRLTLIEKNLNGSGWKQIASMTHDALGQLKAKKISPAYNSAAGLETLTYDYNIRGWLLGANREYAKSTSSTTNYFGFDLGYDKQTLGSLGSYVAAQYNGNISGTTWKSKGSAQVRKYDFTYDGANRLTGADFNQYNSGFNKSAGVDFSITNLTYDANGNILTQNQQGLKVSSSGPVDQLTYHYKDYSNQLKNVVDGINDPATKLGDFRSSQDYMTSLGNTKTDAAVDYDYDANGNLKYDNNKDITAIAYNYLNLPQSVTVKNKGSIEYVYDAAGNKIKKVVHETGKPDQTTLYLFGTYENDVLQFLPQEEGRIRYVAPADNPTAGTFNWDYFVKDHLGNVRMVLTEEQKTDVYQAGMEEANRSREVAMFGDKVATKSWDKPAGFESTPDANNQKVVRLYSSDPEKATGPGVILKVMAGDKIAARTLAWYQATGMQYSSSPVSSTFIANLALQLFTGLSGMPHGAGVDIAGGNGFQPGMEQFLTNSRTQATGGPKAFLNWVLLDEEQLKYVQGGAVPVPHLNAGDQRVLLEANGGNAIEMTRNGYLYVFVSNESDGEVFFDDIRVEHVHGPLTEENHYYPFGLAMSGISSKAMAFGQPENKYKFQGKELQSDEFRDGSGLEWEDFGARMYDNQIGRWMTVDPLANKYPNVSPYVAMDNNPISIIDPTGKSGEPVIDKEKKTITVTSNITFYGSDGNGELAAKAAANIQSQWNTANGKTTIDGVEYSVKFVVTGCYDNSVTADDISKNTDIKNNYVKLVASGIDVSYMDGAGSNTGVFLISNVNDANSTTETHEFGHGFGLEHPADVDLRSPAGSTTPADAPGIMYPRGTAVDAQYTYDPSKGATAGTPGVNATNTMNPSTRKVNQKDINNLGLDKLNYDPTTGKAQLGKLTNTYH
jgi:RHS repeat-associated protein